MVATPLDKSNPLPLYHQLKEALLSHIQSGEWLPEQQLPSERALCEQFQISRITVRQALADLEQEGWIVRDQGRGAFVSRPRIEQRLNHLTSFTQDMRARGQRPGSVVLQQCLVRPTSWVAHYLGLRASQRQVILLKRMRTANNERIAVEKAFLNYQLCRPILEDDLSQQSLYARLTELCNIVPTRAEQQIQAAACPTEEARLLKIKSGSPVLHIRRTTYDQHDQPFEFVESYYRGDKYVFYAELRVDVAPQQTGSVAVKQPT
ncbi:MAG: GntR family transcriptional regulator [Candidatus Roseilinea sp.]|uniref:GntR family transcriptional regulator n=1 Tax=Candidatus Roseilinea sp. TaxID=2838777 RepID=UPI00404A80B5